MGDFFKAYKRYIIRHPKMVQYKHTADKAFDREKLYDVYKEIVKDVEPKEEDCALIYDFVRISQYLHDIYVEMYKNLYADLHHLNMTGMEAAECLVACLNREYKVIWKKREEAMKKAEKGVYLTSDMFEFKLQSPEPGIGMLDARASLEAATDSYNLIMNYLRHFLDEKFEMDDAKENEFAERLIWMFQITQIAVVFKHSYDDILYNNGFVKVDDESKSIVFDYDSHENLILLRAGDMMFAERRLHVMSTNLHNHIKPRLYRYVSDRRIKRSKIENCVITLEFGQGNAKEHKKIVDDLHASIDAFYEFLEGETVLPQMANATVDEAISVWGTIQSNKKFIPFVITNYPTFTGFSYNGVYVIDSHSFLAYMQGGYITMREMGMKGDPVIAARRFYQNEDQYSDNFENYLQRNPIKEIFRERIYIRDLPLMPNNTDTYKVVSKSAEVVNDHQFNIS